MSLSDIFTIRFAAFTFTTLVALYLATRIWKSSDPRWFKVFLTFVVFLPFFGPLFVFWILNFPNPMHPSMQARNAKQINTYSYPTTRKKENE